MAELAPRSRTAGRLLLAAVGLGFGLRAAAAVAVDRVGRGKGRLCLFDDTEIYWQLAGAIRRGAPFAVEQWGLPHFALRTPGYPLFLAACQWAFGMRTLPVRLVQAALGAACVAMVFRLVLVARVGADRGWGVAATASVLVAIDPFSVGISALILSEGVFMPLMVASLWGLATLWRAPGEAPGRSRAAVALATGALSGAAILVKPSWALFIPAALTAWVATAKGRRGGAIRGSAAVLLGLAIAMAPWWARNAGVYGRFVPTALWLGASLYDGLNPGATGASDMAFLDAPDLRALDETAQDAELRDRALRFAAGHPVAVARLASVKLSRYWSPWPNAESFRSPRVAIASAVAALPAFGLMLVGAWDRRRDARALVLLGGPVLYFAAVHMAFVSSIRYRIPGALPALGLAAIGAGRLRVKFFGLDPRRGRCDIGSEGGPGSGSSGA